MNTKRLQVDEGMIAFERDGYEPVMQGRKLNVGSPTIEAIKALDGRIFAILDASELETLEFYRAQGRKFGVTVTIINKADPTALAAAKSRQEADRIMKSANSLVSVTVQ